MDNLQRSGRLTNQRRKLPGVLRVVLIYSIAVCFGLYFYYLIAQDITNPVAVQGVLRESECLPASISKQGVRTGIPVLRSVYAFPSRSKDALLPEQGSPVCDQLTEYVEYETTAECQAAALGRQIGSKRTIWAGENPLSDRFRARFTEDRDYPPLALLWVPVCIAALILWLWRRATR